jgi:surface polysaccharide O-acyltransferase-like enzyme
MRFAKWLFLIAGVYGLIALLPQYFLEQKNGLDFPPPVTHPEYYYGFIGVAVAWQILFLILARNPIRYRAMMIPAILEKASFGIAVIVLFLQNRVSSFTLGFGIVDLLLGALFMMAYVRTGKV